ncbi:MAG TPA: sigma 54-interacting transcriptional regulator, partial [Gemmataceae bacterium]|nr:sigma 54-interacting transcriptional regulator [Gemmataceae bacterium]
MCEDDDCFRRLFEATNIIPWEADAHTWRFTYVGPQAVRILGYPVQQWYEPGFWSSHLHPDDRDDALDLCRRSFEKGEDHDFEYRMVGADGGIVWLHDLVAVEVSGGRPRKLRGFMIDVSERSRLVEQLEERLRFETVLSDLSARFINLPADQVDQEIEAGLRRLVEYLRLDRSTLFQLCEGDETLAVTHCWAAPGFEPLKQLITQEEVPWALQKVLRGETIIFSSVEELPEEAARDKATLRRTGPKANVSFPLSAGGSAVFGALAFGKMSEERAWPESLVQRLRIFAQMLANALVRKRAEQKLQQALSEIKQLQDRLQQENVYLRQEFKLLNDHTQIIGQSPAIKRALSQLEKVAGTDTTALLFGETGTGKELVATAIHNLSSRRDRTMVRVNCAALPATLVESELFGREKGAYTGALSKQIGRFELAHGSTIFLDEVGDLPPEVQIKLLR